MAALITAALLHPPVQWLQKRLHWPRKLSSLLILLLLFGLMGGGIGYLGYAAGAELVSLVQNWEGLLEGLRTVLDQLELISFQLWTLVPPELTESVQSVADGLMDWLNTAVPNILQNAVAFTTEKAKRVPSFGLALIIYVMAAYMLTVDYPELRARAAQHTHERLLRFVVQVRNIALAAFGGYLRAELLLSVGVFFILLVGFAVYTAGIIGFVGLVIPHMVRILFGTDHKKLIPISALLGAIFLLWSDVLCRVVLPGKEIPIGVLTALVGAPVFIYLMARKKYGFGGGD